MKKSFKYLFYFSLSIVLILLSYIFIAYFFTLFPTTISKEVPSNKKIYILYNDLHSDIVFNFKDLNLSQFPKFKNRSTGYLSFGWGDKETYLNTPNIADIKISTSLKALFINTPSLMHVSYIQNIHRYKNIKTIYLSTEQQEALKASIFKSIKFEEQQYKGYGKEDVFYTAKGHYNLINTCNTWTGDKLREINVSMNHWTPFTYSVTSALP